MRQESQKQREQRLGYNKMFYYAGDDDYEKTEKETLLDFCPKCLSDPCSCDDNIIKR